MSGEFHVAFPLLVRCTIQNLGTKRLITINILDWSEDATFDTNSELDGYIFQLPMRRAMSFVKGNSLQIKPTLLVSLQ